MKKLSIFQDFLNGALAVKNRTQAIFPQSPHTLLNGFLPENKVAAPELIISRNASVTLIISKDPFFLDTRIITFFTTRSKIKFPVTNIILVHCQLISISFLGSNSFYNQNKFYELISGQGQIQVKRKVKRVPNPCQSDGSQLRVHHWCAKY